MVAEEAAGPPPFPRGWRSGPPDFVGVGAQRAGTSWWWRLIASHPEIHVPDQPLPRQKERQFFAGAYRPSFDEARVLEYRRHFPRPPGSIAGEWTPRYMFDAWTPACLARAAPDARLLVMLRDPVERLRSALGIAARRQGAEKGVGPAQRNEAVHRGMYASQLRLVRRHFDRARLLVLQYERCRLRPAQELARTFSFLAVDAGHAAPAELLAPRARPTPKPELSSSERDDLAAVFAADLAALASEYPEIDLDLWPSAALGDA